ILRQILEEDLASIPTHVDADDEVLAVRRDADARDVGLVATVAEDQLVRLGIGADLVEVDLREVFLVARGHGAGIGVARVVEAFSIGEPGDRRVARVLDLLREISSGLDTAEEERALLAPR